MQKAAVSALKRGGGPKKMFLRSATLGSLIKQKGSFMTKTIVMFICQLLVTFAIFHLLSKSVKFQEWVAKHSISFLVSSLIILLGLIIVLALVPLSIPVKLLLFTVFSMILGIIFARLKTSVPEEIFRASFVGAIAVFCCTFILGVLLVLLGINLWWLGGLLFVALLGLVITSIVFLFIEVSKKTHRIKAAIAIALFALFVLYDTNQILQRDYSGDFVTASLDYYLDMINIFLNLIHYFMNSE